MKYKKVKINFIAETLKGNLINVIWDGKSLKISKDTKLEKDDFVSVSNLEITQ